MGKRNTIKTDVVRILMAVAFLMGCHALCYSYSPFTLNSDKECLTRKDSLILEMVEFIQPDFKPTKEKCKHIEKRIKLFPHKVIRRDTTAYFLNTAYAMAYYEFVKHDYKKAKAWGDEFTNSAMPPGLLSHVFCYPSIGMNASTALINKGNFKSTKDKNSWYEPIKLDLTDSIDWNPNRDYIRFIDSFLDDVPLDCSEITYRQLLSTYYEGAGRIELLNNFMRKGFIQRCADANREDILAVIFDLWKISMEDLTCNSKGYLEYRNPSLHVDSVAVANMYDEILSFDTERNKIQIDSLISIGAKTDLTPRILCLLSLYYGQSRFRKVVEACEKYQSGISRKSLHTLHDYWALGLSNLGKYEEALRHYDIAIANAADRSTLSTIKLNKACTLGEMGRTEDAVAIFMQEKEQQKTPFEKFVWYDNLGHVFSHDDPKTALVYLEAAEDYMDSGTIYSERKIRHFCRKARLLEHNKYLQRNAIDRAIELARQDGNSGMARAMAYSEAAAFASSVFDYKEADRLFQAVEQIYGSLEDSDLRKIGFNRQYASNLYLLGHKDEALQRLIHQLEVTKQSYGERHGEYARLLCTLIQLACSHPTSEIDIDGLYKELSTRKNNHSPILSAFETAKSEIAYLVYSSRWNEALKVVQNTISLPLNPIEKLSMIQQYEAVARGHLNHVDYIRRMTEMIPIVKVSMIEGLLTLSGNEERALSSPLSDMIDGVLAKGANEIALQLCLFQKGLLYTKKKTIERKLSVKRPLKKVSKRLQSTREELNRAVAYNDSIHIPELRANVFKLERELGNNLSSEKKLYSELDRTLAQVMERLSTKDLAVEFVRFSDGRDINYGAFLIDHNELKEFVRIGSEEEVLSNPEIVWTWLPDYIDRYEALYFCPDGVLNRLGVEYMNPYGISSCPQIKFHRVFHLSEIDGHSHGIGNKIVIVGISDHNSPINNANPVDRGNWTDLPNVEYEIELITHNLGSHELKVLLNDQATEPIVSGISGDGVSTIHFSTHGFYRSNESLSQAVLDTSNEDYHIARRFLSGGLTEVGGMVLRQGNISWKSPYILDEYDDLLTAEEIELLSFPNLNLTVLSACDTGLGHIDSEGVWGLQRAFRIAGTKNLICTLSKVDDYWTAQFMDAFYEEAAKGTSVYDSFHKAQRWLYRELPDNPEIWSSFILIE